MVRVIVAVALALSVLAGGTVYAAQATLPGDALYPVKLGTEQMAMMLPGDSMARAERGLAFANRRVEELEDLAEEGRTQYLERARERYEHALNQTLTRIEEAGDQALVAGNVTERVAEATMKHMEVLARVYEQVPEQAKPAIARAMEASQRGHDAALGALERKGPPEGVPPGPEDGEEPPENEQEPLEEDDDEGPPEGVPPGPPTGVPPAGP
jgi:hypothetical protein